MATSDGVTLEEDNEEQVKDWNRRWESIAGERRNKADMQDAMSHPKFKDRANTFIDELARETRWWRLGHVRPPLLVVPPKACARFATLQAVIEAMAACGIRFAHSTETLVRYWARSYEKERNAQGRVHFPSELVPVSNKELGYPKGCKLGETKNAARSRCDLGNAGMFNGLVFGLEFPAQEFDDVLVVAMEPWECDDGKKRLLELDYTGNLLVVNGLEANNDTFFPGGARFLFERDRSKQT